jgi:hypothetical protein
VARDKRLEESVAAAGEADRTTFEKRRREAENAFESAMDGIEAAVPDAGVSARERWNDTIASVARQIEVMRAARRRWQAERRVDSAMRAADRAEQNAAPAVALAADA